MIPSYDEMLSSHKKLWYWRYLMPRESVWDILLTEKKASKKAVCSVWSKFYKHMYKDLYHVYVIYVYEWIKFLVGHELNFNSSYLWV